MPGPWLSWTRTLSCKSDGKDVVYDPSLRLQHAQQQQQLQQQQQQQQPGRLSTTASSAAVAAYKSCNCSLGNLKDVVHGNTRVAHRASSSGSPRSNKEDYLQEVSQDPLFYDSPLLSPPVNEQHAAASYSGMNNSSSNTISAREVVSVVRVAREYSSSSSLSKKKFSGCNGCNVAMDTMDSMVCYNNRDHNSSALVLSRQHQQQQQPQLICQRCGDAFSKFEALEHHHIVQHAVSELGKGDSSRNIVEIIFRSSWMSSKSSISTAMQLMRTTSTASCGGIERVLKVHNSQRTLSKFEDYRDSVKFRANCMPKKNARCIADGNELLRFYGATAACPLGADGSTSLCSMPSCAVCRIIRSGFTSKRDRVDGICTTATSGSAHNIAFSDEYQNNNGRLAMLVCRVIAGRVYRSSCAAAGRFMSEPPNGYDSIVFVGTSDSGNYCASTFEDLTVFNPRAVLPCFVVIYRC